LAVQLGPDRNEFLDAVALPICMSEEINSSLLSDLKEAYYAVSSEQRKETFRLANELTSDIKTFKSIIKFIPHITWTKEMIDKLKIVPSNELVSVMELLLFIPEVIRLRNCRQGVSKALLFAIPTDSLQSALFPYYKQVLNSEDRELVQMVSELLADHFILVLEPKLKVDSELGQLVANKYLETHRESIPKNHPFYRPLS